MGEQDHDFVREGKRLSSDRIALIRSRINVFLDAAPPFPPNGFDGRGVVIVGGSGEYSVPMWVALHALRRSRSELPVEVWFPRAEVPRTCGEKDLLEKLGATVRTFDEYVMDGSKKLRRFEYKV